MPQLDSSETNPLPSVSSAKVWNAPPSNPATGILIREKMPTPPSPIRRKRADGTEEILAEDIMIVVPAAAAAIAAAPEIEVELEEPEFRAPAYSIHATQEILADDVIDVQLAASVPTQVPQWLAQYQQPRPQPQPPQQARDEAPSAPPPPWTIDAPDEFDFPSRYPVMSGPYPAMATGPRLTNFSATEVFRRRHQGMKVVVAAVTFAVAVVAVAAVARLSPALASGGPVGIAIRSPKQLDTSPRVRERIVGVAPRAAAAAETVTVSIDDLAPVRHFTRPLRHHRR